MVLCTCCRYGTGVNVVLCKCHTCGVAGMWYYVCALCSRGIMTCVFIVLHFVYVYVLCFFVHQVYVYVLCGVVHWV